MPSDRELLDIRMVALHPDIKQLSVQQLSCADSERLGAQPGVGVRPPSDQSRVVHDATAAPTSAALYHRVIVSTGARIPDLEC
jgi:hypothetical protein